MVMVLRARRNPPSSRFCSNFSIPVRFLLCRSGSVLACSVSVWWWVFVQIRNWFWYFVLLLKWIQILIGNEVCVTGFRYEHSWSVHVEIWEINEVWSRIGWERKRNCVCWLFETADFDSLWLFSLLQCNKWQSIYRLSKQGFSWK